MFVYACGTNEFYVLFCIVRAKKKNFSSNWSLMEYRSSTCKVKAKCTLVQALRICTGRTARRGSRGIALPFHDHGTRRGWGVRVMPRPLFTPRKDPVPIVQEAGWVPGPVWTGAENLHPTGIRSPDRPARSQLLFTPRKSSWYSFLLEAESTPVP